MSAPACLQVPDGTLGSYRDEVGELMELAGRPLDPHQLVAVEALTAYGRGGKWPTFVAGVEGPRQTVGKTGGIVLPVALFLCLTFPELADERTWTAHRLDTTSKTFRDARQLLGVDAEDRREWAGPLAARVRNVGLENGNEHIEFVNGSILWFKARSGRAGRGLSGHDVFADELLYADDAQFGALLPTMATRSAQGMPRLWTASSSALPESAFLRRQRHRAVTGDPGIVYVGWWARGSWEDPECADSGCTHVVGSAGCSLDDPERRREANPGLGVRTSEAFLEEMRGTLSPTEFGREFLGWQQLGEEAYDCPIPLDGWAACVEDGSSIVGAPVLTLDVALDRSWAAIAAGGYNAAGQVHVEVTAYRRGVEWVADEFAGQARRHGALVTALDPKGPAGVLVPELERAGLRVTTLGLSDQTAGCGALLDAVRQGTVRHLGDPVLLGALGAAVRRDVGDAWAWGRRKSSGDICPLVAITEAFWMATLHARRPGDDQVGVWVL